MKRKNIVVIGGGTGTYTVLSGLKEYPVNLTAIVSMADDGGSTRVLREEFGMLPPGSVRPALVALSNAPETLSEIFNFRFAKGTFKGHNFGNLFITALTEQFGNFEKALQEAGKILNIQGEVIPSTMRHIRLMAELENGKLVQGEADIDVPKHDGRLKIQNVWLSPRAKANPKAVAALQEADLIVLGPGDLFSSVIPNLLVEGISSAIKKSRAKKVFVCNIMTKFGETTGFTAEDFLTTLEKYLGKNVIDCVVVNKTKPLKARVRKYEKEKAEFVRYDKAKLKKRVGNVVGADLLRQGGFIRHDSDKLAKVLFALL